MFKLIRANLRLADLILIILLILLMIGSLTAKIKNETELRVFIYKDNILWGEYPLSEKRIVRIDAHNTIEIRDGRYSMRVADCPDKRCVKQGWTSRLPIICLPNRVSVEVRAAHQEAPLMLY
ncbi:MAG: NusG domain II-containing protein [Candidatus Cloacimonadaceae bacterium]|nr:NusG domain II-containing protein [Candidatus Cloacimonadaceae bacterium]MDP3114642.1 NusG domain II-containing protein [Candidatus Cloacimonadaceae bacterium]